VDSNITRCHTNGT